MDRHAMCCHTSRYPPSPRSAFRSHQKRRKGHRTSALIRCTCWGVTVVVNGSLHVNPILPERRLERGVHTGRQFIRALPAAEDGSCNAEGNGGVEAWLESWTGRFGPYRKTRRDGRSLLRTKGAGTLSPRSLMSGEKSVHGGSKTRRKRGLCTAFVSKGTRSRKSITASRQGSGTFTSFTTSWVHDCCVGACCVVSVLVASLRPRCSRPV